MHTSLLTEFRPVSQRMEDDRWLLLWIRLLVRIPHHPSIHKDLDTYDFIFMCQGPSLSTGAALQRPLLCPPTFSKTFHVCMRSVSQFVLIDRFKAACVDMYVSCSGRDIRLPVHFLDGVGMGGDYCGNSNGFHMIFSMFA